MKFGAKVLDDWWAVLVELDLCIAGCNGAKLVPLGGENDWLRLCAAGLPMPEGEVMIADLGLVVGAARPGDGEGEPLSKGLLRHRALPGTVVDMLPISFCKDSRRRKARNQIAYKGMMALQWKAISHSIRVRLDERKMNTVGSRHLAVHHKLKIKKVNTTI